MCRNYRLNVVVWAKFINKKGKTLFRNVARPMRPSTAVLVLCIATLAACADYSFTVNERVVYRPAPVFTDYSLPDDNLAACVRQHIEDAHITAAEALKDLNCSHAGISSLEGLELFQGLVRLKLTDNAVSDTAPLALLPKLRELALDANAITSASPLLPLQTLEFLDLRKNGELACATLAPLLARSALRLQAPAHCS